VCAGKDQEDIEYMGMDKGDIHVAEYLTDILPKKTLEEKLKQSIVLARENHIKMDLYNS
jgi:hypothetical protein